MKKLLAAILLCAFCIAFAACQPTPDEPFVVSKGDGKLLGTIYGESVPELSEPYQADTHWTETLNGKVEDRLTVEVDADVHVPDTLKYPVYSITKDEYTEDSVESIINAFVGDKELFYTNDYVTDILLGYDQKTGEPIYQIVPYMGRTASQRSIDACEYQLNDPNSPFNKYFVPECDRQEEIDQTIETTTKEIEHYTYIRDHQSELLTKLDKSYFEYLQEAQKDKGGVAFNTADGKSSVSIDCTEEGETRIIYMPLEDKWMVTPDEGIIKDSNPNYVTIDKTEAQKKADVWLQKLGLSDWTMSNVSVVQIGTMESMLANTYFLGTIDHEDEYYEMIKYTYTPPEAWMITYTPAREGIPSLVFSNKQENEYTNNDWTVPSLKVAVTDDGVVYVMLINSNAHFSECLNENVALLPFEDVKNKFRDYIVMNTDFVGSVQVNDTTNEYYESSIRNEEGHIMTRISINDVRLGYIKIKKQNSDEYIMVPAWCFYGLQHDKITNADGQLQVDENGEGIGTHPAGHVFLCVNAIDGSIIDLTQGY